MPQDDTRDLWQRKEDIRHQGHANRNAQVNKDELSRAICKTFAEQPEYASARTVLFYLDARAEVRTRHFLSTALTQGKRVVVPYCLGEQIKLFHLQDMNELSLGAFQVLEPKPEFRSLTEKPVAVAELDLVMVPGVAFDRQGGRIGHGLGYYDKLLKDVRPDTPLIALAFESQLFPEIPTDAHDIRMDKIITERAVYAGRGRKR